MATKVDPPYTGVRVFAAEFEGWLRTFQVRNGLEPDGIVGPKTLLYLMRHSITEPSLARHSAGDN
jgi:murein L,D-transpeptidase YcbB/YkuD